MKTITGLVFLSYLTLASSAFAGIFGNSAEDKVCDGHMLYMQTYDLGRYPVGREVLVRMRPDFFNLGMETIPVVENMYETARRANLPPSRAPDAVTVIFHKNASIPCAAAIVHAIKTTYLTKYQKDIQVVVEPISVRLHATRRTVEIWWPHTDVNSFVP